MVKRSKSPEIVEDARYFTVYQPYPLNPNWLDEDDQKACAMWIAECIGPNHLWAIHEKPKSRNMILLEVSKDFTDHAALLGEHRWSDFLKKPSDEDKGRVTQVFHSFYARARDAQKDGWKVVNVSSDWFHEWVPGKNLIIHPYPSTHWCATPVEDKTNKTLCRPLPVDQKPPPPRNSQAPVVGSRTWVASQAQEAPTPAALASAWSKKSNSQTNESDQSRSASGASSPFPQIRAELPPALPKASAPVLPAAKGKTAWGQSVPLQTFVAGSARPNGKKSWAPQQQLNNTKSPFAEEPLKGPMNAWVKPLKVPASHRHTPSVQPANNRARSPSPWGRGDTNNDAWFTEDTFTNTPDVSKQTQVDTVAANSKTESNKDEPPSSPRRGRNNRRDRKDDGPSSPRKHNGNSTGPNSPQSDTKPQWDIPSAKSTGKRAPKPWDKKKKEKETVETMGFGLTDDDPKPGEPLSLESESTGSKELDGGQTKSKKGSASKKAKIDPDEIEFDNDDEPKKRQEENNGLGFGANPVTDWAAEMDIYDATQSKDDVKKANGVSSSAPVSASSGSKKKKAKGAAVDRTGSQVSEVNTSRTWGSWGVAAPTDEAKDKVEAVVHDSFCSNMEKLGKVAHPEHAPKKEDAKVATSLGAADNVWGTWDVASTAQSGKSKGKKKAAGRKANASDNTGGPPRELVDTPVPSTNTAAGLDMASDDEEYDHHFWDLPPMPYIGAARDMDESEFHPWERNAAPDLNTWGPNDAPIVPAAPPKEATEILMCPTHKNFCKKSICREMAKLVREQQNKKRLAEAATRPRGGRRNSTRGRSQRGASKSDAGKGSSEHENENEERNRSPDDN